MSRDPRLDPQPGDVLRKGKRTRRIYDVGEKYLEVREFRETGSGEVEVLPRYPWISQWRRWAKDAEVIKSA